MPKCWWWLNGSDGVDSEGDGIDCDGMVVMARMVLIVVMVMVVVVMVIMMVRRMMVVQDMLMLLG